jgi:hypothetical protein
LGDRKNLVAIRQWGCIDWQSTRFGHNLTYSHYRMVTKTF